MSKEGHILYKQFYDALAARTTLEVEHKKLSQRLVELEKKIHSLKFPKNVEVKPKAKRK